MKSPNEQLSSSVGRLNDDFGQNLHPLAVCGNALFGESLLLASEALKLNGQYDYG